MENRLSNPLIILKIVFIHAFQTVGEKHPRLGRKALRTAALILPLFFCPIFGYPECVRAELSARKVP